MNTCSLSPLYLETLLKKRKHRGRMKNRNKFIENRDNERRDIRWELSPKFWKMTEEKAKI